MNGRSSSCEGSTDTEVKGIDSPFPDEDDNDRDQEMSTVEGGVCDVFLPHADGFTLEFSARDMFVVMVTMVGPTIATEGMAF